MRSEMTYQEKEDRMKTIDPILKTFMKDWVFDPGNIVREDIEFQDEEEYGTEYNCEVFHQYLQELMEENFYEDFWNEYGDTLDIDYVLNDYDFCGNFVFKPLSILKDYIKDYFQSHIHRYSHLGVIHRLTDQYCETENYM